MYRTAIVNPDDLVYLRPLKTLLDGSLCMLVDEHGKTDRLSQDGVMTGTARIQSIDIGIIYQDFRVNGASVGKDTARRMMALMEQVQAEGMPLVFLMHSLGVRITQGRTIFDDAFSVIPSLFALKRRSPLITVAMGNSIGINAIYFAQGHIRLAQEAACLNLAGPEVHRRFFGDRNQTYQQFTSAAHQQRVNTLVHETAPDHAGLFARIRELVPGLTLGATGKATPANVDQELAELLQQLGEVTELFPAKGPDVRVFLGEKDGRHVGYFINPPRRPNNLLSVAAIDKCLAALELFNTLGASMVSFADCPGGDPRQGESDADGLGKLTLLVQRIIEYPHAKMGFVYGRCFGGTGMLLFPKIFGGDRIVAVEGAQIGIMNDNIIKELLSGTPRLLAEWQTANAEETPDLADLIAAGTVSKVIKKELISWEISAFLSRHPAKQASDDASYVVLG